MPTDWLTPSLDDPAREADFRRRWPKHKHPGLYLCEKDLRALRRRQRRRRELLDLLGPDVAHIAAAVFREGQRRE